MYKIESTNLVRRQGSLGSSRPDPMPQAALWERGLHCRPCGMGTPGSNLPFPPAISEFPLNVVGRRGPSAHLWRAVSRRRLPDMPREHGLGRPAVEPSGSTWAKEAIWHCWAGPRQQVAGDLHATPEPGACSEGRQQGPDSGGDKFQQLVGTSSCSMELLPAALRGWGRKEIHFVYLLWLSEKGFSGRPCPYKLLSLSP